MEQLIAILLSKYRLNRRTLLSYACSKNKAYYITEKKMADWCLGKRRALQCDQNLDVS